MNTARLRVFTWLLIALFVSPSAQAINMDAITFDMLPEQDFVSKLIHNNTDSAKIYTVSALAIDKPVRGEIRSRISNGEVLYAPLRLVIQSGSHDYFKIFYRGPEDDRERYYRVIFREIPLTLLKYEEADRKTQLQPEVAVESIMVVRPRKLKLDYVLDTTHGTLKNTGNTYFNVLIHQGCNGTDEEAESIYVLPGETLRRNSLKGNNRKLIVALDKFIPLGNECFGGA